MTQGVLIGAMRLVAVVNPYLRAATNQTCVSGNTERRFGYVSKRNSPPRHHNDRRPVFRVRDRFDGQHSELDDKSSTAVVHDGDAFTGSSVLQFCSRDARATDIAIRALISQRLGAVRCRVGFWVSKADTHVGRTPSYRRAERVHAAADTRRLELRSSQREADLGADRLAP
jgi:hypothetical protein